MNDGSIENKLILSDFKSFLIQTWPELSSQIEAFFSNFDFKDQIEVYLTPSNDFSFSYPMFSEEYLSDFAGDVIFGFSYEGGLSSNAKDLEQLKEAIINLPKVQYSALKPTEIDSAINEIKEDFNFQLKNRLTTEGYDLNIPEYTVLHCNNSFFIENFETDTQGNSWASIAPIGFYHKDKKSYATFIHNQEYLVEILVMQMMDCLHKDKLAGSFWKDF